MYAFDPQTATSENALFCQSVTLNETSQTPVSRSSEVFGRLACFNFCSNLQNVVKTWNRKSREFYVDQSAMTGTHAERPVSDLSFD